MAFCIQCGHRNPDEGRFCDQCGNPLVWGADKASESQPPHPSAQACPVCKKPSSSDKFCTSCGHRFGAVSAPVPVEPAMSPAVELRLNTSSEEVKPQKSGFGNGHKRKSHLVLGVAVGLLVLGIGAYVIMSPSSSEPSPQPVLSIESQTAPPPAESKSAPEPLPVLPLATESSPSPVAGEKQVKPVQPTTASAVPRAAPVRPKPAPPVKETPAAQPPASLPTAEKPVPREVKKQFSCGDLPFGLLVACGLEGKDVIRKCAPDLKTWNHDIPGCNRQESMARDS